MTDKILIIMVWKFYFNSTFCAEFKYIYFTFMYLRDVKTQEKDLFIDTLFGDLPMHLSFNLVQSYD